MSRHWKHQCRNCRNVYYSETAEDLCPGCGVETSGVMDISRVEVKGLSFEKMAEIINTNFCDPYLEEGMVKAQMLEDGVLYLAIGRRDVRIYPDGTTEGGTLLV